MSVNTAASSAQPQPKPSFFSGFGCWASLVILIISLVFYIIACATPAMVFGSLTWIGLEVLVLGWQGVFIGQFAWFANAFWFLSLLLVFFRRWFLTIGMTIITILIALDSLTLFGASIPLDEANVNKTTFLYYHVGFYFWMASIAVLGIGAVIAWAMTRTPRAK